MTGGKDPAPKGLNKTVMDLQELKKEERILKLKLVANGEKQRAINADIYSKKHNIYPLDKFYYTTSRKTIKVIFNRFEFMNNDVWNPIVNPITVRGTTGKSEIKIYDISKLKKIIQ